MAKLNKRYKENLEKRERDHRYPVEEAFDLLTGFKKAKFDETIDLSIRLGVDPKHADQMVRGSVSLPNGTGQTVRVLVFAKGEKVAEAKEAGADFVGDDDMVKKIQEGWLDFDRVVATPDMMASVGKLGGVLGPRGLMPNPKVGTVTFEVSKAVSEVKAGKISYKVDKNGVVHTIIGKASFEADKLKQNFLAVMDSIQKAKPAAAKGTYVRSITLSTTMSPGIKVDPMGLTA